MSDSDAWYCRFCLKEITDDFFCSTNCPSEERDFDSWDERAMDQSEYDAKVKAAEAEYQQARKDGLFL